MIDFARITVCAGDGGSGSGSFRQIKGKRYGRADGGNGGDGGDVYIEASNDLNTLERYRYVKDYRAENGRQGFSNLRRGGDGEDLVLKVPVGTVVKAANVTKEPNEPNVSSALVFDLTQAGQRVLISRGGQGGRGNAYLRDEFGRRPRVGERGQVGEIHELTLELKIIADVGVIGLPNAGKSTLLARLTRAHPKIAGYPFTTLEPNLGVLTVGSHPRGVAGRDRAYPGGEAKIVIADIPGLIEGASRGKGLGYQFLRHIERTKLLVHMIDVTSNDLWRDYLVVRDELKRYSKELAKKREIIVLNKIDGVGKNEVQQELELFKAKRKRVVAISAKTGEGFEQLIKLLLRSSA